MAIQAQAVRGTAEHGDPSAVTARMLISACQASFKMEEFVK